MPRHGAGGLGAEHGQRRALGGDDRDPDADAHGERPLRGHQRQLVERQRPAALRRHDEGDAVHVAALDVLDHAAEGLVEMAVVDRGRVRVPVAGPGAQRQQQGLVAERAARGRVHGPGGGVDPGERVRDELGARVGGDPFDGIAPRGGVGEGLAHAHRPVGERELTREQGDVDRVAGQVVQRQGGLEAGDARSRDEHAEGAAVRGCGLAVRHGSCREHRARRPSRRSRR
jgi:hypothetical protein